MTEVSILSKCGRRKAVVGLSMVTYYSAAVSSDGTVSWRFLREAQYTMPRHVMLDAAAIIINTPVVHKGR